MAESAAKEVHEKRNEDSWGRDGTECKISRARVDVQPVSPCQYIGSTFQHSRIWTFETSDKRHAKAGWISRTVIQVEHDLICSRHCGIISFRSKDLKIYRLHRLE